MKSPFHLLGSPGLGGVFATSSPVDAAFLPTDFSGLQLWLKADTGTYQDSGLSTPAVADTDPLGGWADQSGNGNHAVQATAGKRPSLRTNLLASKALIRFDGSDDALEAPSVNTTSGLTCFLVGIRRGAPGANASLLVLKKGAGLNDYDTASTGVLGFYPADTRLSAYRNGAELSSAGAWPAVGTAFIHTAHLDGSQHTAYINTTAGTPAASIGNFDFTSVLFAARWYSSAEQNPHFQFDFAEVILYAASLTSGQISQVHAYLNARWGIY